MITHKTWINVAGRRVYFIYPRLKERHGEKKMKLWQNIIFKKKTWQNI